MSRLALPSLVLRVDFDREGRIGHGKIDLLEMVHACGSISAAARTMNMSYRHAWLLLDEVKHICGRDVISGHKGGDQGGGAELTPFGIALVKRYRKIEQSVKEAVRDDLIALQVDMSTHRRGEPDKQRPGRVP
jgi:molybdate transport system regulatory protein